MILHSTKNVRCIEVPNDLFEHLCEIEYDKKVKEIQQNYDQLFQSIEKQIGKWMKLKEKDCYFNTKAKMLFPDTRKLRATDLSVCNDIAMNSYKAVVDYMESCDETKKKEWKKKASENGCIIPSAFDDELAGFLAAPPTREQLKILFDDVSCPCIDKVQNVFLIRDGSIKPYLISSCDDSYFLYLVGNANLYRVGSYCQALKVSIHEFQEDLSSVELVIRYKLYGEKFDEALIEQINAYSDILEKGVSMSDFDALKSYLKTTSTMCIGNVDLRSEAIENDVKAEEIDLNATEGLGKELKQYLDCCDYTRARIQKYNSKWYLSDEGKGHWELWTEAERETKNKHPEEKDNKEDKAAQPKKNIITLKESAIARNPFADVKHDAVVGIDFGTKSTIVALQDGDDQIIPLRVGMADYSEEPKPFHFENPTVMQFVDLNEFMTKYDMRSGRPMTSWDDLLISHEAFDNLIHSENSIDIAAFATDLKQWAAGQGKNKNGGHLIIKDAKGFRFDMDSYMSLTDEDVDLIELYAYYIGLFINNMHMGIHLDYILSFPETFSKEVKEHIVKSFTNGIKKSIPSVIFLNQECQEEFRVRQGPSEPAAYAACALEQYGIEPTDKGVFYGIFDFGGGTTDYDYGVWKNAPKEEYTYNYVLRHYGSGGDKTLGGENILELLAYYIFCDDTKNKNGKSNLEMMRKNRIVFYRPEEGKVFTGTEALTNDSESALLNTKLMMEVLRPIWEERRDVMQAYSKKSGTITLDKRIQNAYIAFDSDGSVSANMSLFSDTDRIDVVLNIDMDLVNTIINNRIESGVKNFFEGLVQAYHKSDDHDSEKIHVFLAGNSSKSKRVIQLFEKYVEKYNAILFEEGTSEEEDADTAQKSNGVSSASSVNNTSQVADAFKKLNKMKNSHFIVYPPLGTVYARRIQKDRKIRLEKNDLLAPTGKTGVAFGLVMCREGSMIKVESENKKNAQIKLNYYIGLNYRKKFKMIFDRDSEYGKWMKFSKISADTETFEFYYSELPEVMNGDIEIRNNMSIHKRKCMVDHVVKDANIYFRFTNPTQLEYVVATEDALDTEKYMSKVYQVSL